MFWFKKLLPFFLSILGLGIVIYYVTPPKSWIEATPYQILYFFTPLFLSLFFLANVFLNSWSRSMVFGFGGMFLLVLLATQNLNWLSGSLTILVTIFLIRIFPKSRLTRGQEFPKITHIFKENE